MQYNDIYIINNNKSYSYNQGQLQYDFEYIDNVSMLKVNTTYLDKKIHF